MNSVATQLRHKSQTTAFRCSRWISCLHTVPDVGVNSALETGHRFAHKAVLQFNFLRLTTVRWPLQLKHVPIVVRAAGYVAHVAERITTHTSSGLPGVEMKCYRYQRLLGLERSLLVLTGTRGHAYLSRLAAIPLALMTCYCYLENLGLFCRRTAATAASKPKDCLR